MRNTDFGNRVNKGDDLIHIDVQTVDHSIELQDLLGQISSFE